MIPRVFKGLNPTSPEYNRIGDLPLSGMAMLMGGNGSTKRTVNNLGKLIEGIGEKGKLPSTGKMLHNLGSGKGVTEMFKGQKAGPGDQESYTTPGYVYGQEPMPLAEAATTAGQLLDAALVGAPALTQLKYGSEGWGGYKLDKWAAKAAKKKPGKGMSAGKAASRSILRG